MTRREEASHPFPWIICGIYGKSATTRCLIRWIGNHQMFKNGLKIGYSMGASKVRVEGTESPSPPRQVSTFLSSHLGPVCQVDGSWKHEKNVLQTRMVSNLAEQGASFTRCGGTKKKLNSFASGAGKLDLGDGIHGTAPRIYHHLPNKSFGISKNCVRSGSLAHFFTWSAIFTSLRARFRYFTFEQFNCSLNDKTYCLTCNALSRSVEFSYVNVVILDMKEL